MKEIVLQFPDCASDDVLEQIKKELPKARGFVMYIETEDDKLGGYGNHMSTSAMIGIRDDITKAIKEKLGL